MTTSRPRLPVVEEVKSAGSAVPAIAGIDAVQTADLLKEGDAAASVDVDGLMVTPPFFLAAATESELWNRFASLATHVNLPIIVYNNPRRTVINLSPEFIGRLAEIDAVVGVKQSDRDFAQISETIRLVGDAAAVYVGPASMILPGVILGAKGYISTGPDLLGPEGAEYYSIIKANDFERARRIHWQLSQIYSMLNKLGTWPAALKVALSLTGKEGGLPRDPIQPLTAEQTVEVQSILERLGILRSPFPVA